MRKPLAYCLAAAAMAALLGGAARAGEVNDFAFDQANDFTFDQAGAKLAVGIGVICNTTDQAEHYVRLRADGARVRPAMEQVNRQAENPQACGLAAIAFRRDKTMDTQTVQGRLMSIVRVNVIGGFDGRSWKRVPATIQYAVMQEKGEAI